MVRETSTAIFLKQFFAQRHSCYPNQDRYQIIANASMKIPHYLQQNQVNARELTKKSFLFNFWGKNCRTFFLCNGEKINDSAFFKNFLFFSAKCLKILLCRNRHFLYKKSQFFRNSLTLMNKISHPMIAEQEESERVWKITDNFLSFFFEFFLFSVA